MRDAHEISVEAQQDPTFTKHCADKKLLDMVDPDQALMSRGRVWTKSEHKMFVDLFEKYGKDWQLIAQKVGNKTRKQVRYYGEVCVKKWTSNPSLHGAHLLDKLIIAMTTKGGRRRPRNNPEDLEDSKNLAHPVVQSTASELLSMQFL